MREGVDDRSFSHGHALKGFVFSAQAATGFRPSVKKSLEARLLEKDVDDGRF
jgi:hypothetical protein